MICIGKNKKIVGKGDSNLVLKSSFDYNIYLNPNAL